MALSLGQLLSRSHIGERQIKEKSMCEDPLVWGRMASWENRKNSTVGVYRTKEEGDLDNEGRIGVRLWGTLSNM